MSRSTIGKSSVVHLSERGWYELSSAIIQKACEDYMMATIYHAPKTRREIEQFFRSNYFKCISNIDPEWLIGELNDKRNIEKMLKQEKEKHGRSGCKEELS